MRSSLYKLLLTVTFFLKTIRIDEMKIRNRNSLFYLYLGFMGVVAFVLMLWITPNGSGVSPDSISYFRAANTFMLGKGYSINGEPVTHFPPLYPLFLSATSLILGNPVQAARFLNAALFGLNVGLVALVVYLTSDRNYYASTLAVIFFLSSKPFLALHSWAWSEPLFISFTLVSIILLSMNVVWPSSLLLVTSALFLGFVVLTRYIGLAFLPPALVIVFIGTRNQKYERRFRDTLLWFAVACTPILLLIIRNMMAAGSATDRAMAYHPVSVIYFVQQFISTFFDFVAPVSLPAGIRPAILAVLGAFLILEIVILFKKHKGINWRSMNVIIIICGLLFFLSYLLFLLISIDFLDASTPLDNRLYSPIYVISIVIIFPLIWTLTKTLEIPMLWWSFLIVLVLSISVKTPDAIRSIVAIQKNGLGYSTRQWRDSETVAFVKSLPKDIKIYSNGADVLSFLTTAQSLSLPLEASPTSLESNSRYDKEIEAVCKDITDTKAILVYFNTIDWRWYLPSQDELMSSCPLNIMWHFKDGTVFDGTIGAPAIPHDPQPVSSAVKPMIEITPT